MKGMCHSLGARGREEIGGCWSWGGRMELEGGRAQSPTRNFQGPKGGQGVLIKACFGAGARAGVAASATPQLLCEWAEWLQDVAQPPHCWLWERHLKASDPVLWLS